MHGFLNVLGAGVMAHDSKQTEETIRAMVADESRTSFRFDAQAFAWKNLTASAEAITDARAHAVISFGCCSFDDPRDGLKTLGMLRPGS